MRHIDFSVSLVYQPTPALRSTLSCKSQIEMKPGYHAILSTDFERVVHNVSEQSKNFTWPYEYNNINTAMLARIIDKASKASKVKWQELLRSRILKPLGMNSTCTTLQEWNQLNATGPKFLGQNYLDDVCSASMGIVTTARDLAKLCHELLRIRYAPGQSKLMSLGIGSIDIF